MNFQVNMTFSSLMPELILMPKTQCLSLFTMAEECSIMLRVRIKLTLYLPNVIYEYYEGVKRTLSPAVTANFLELVLTDGTFHEFVICWVVMAYSTWIFFYTDCRTWWSSVITCAGSFFIYFFFFPVVLNLSPISTSMSKIQVLSHCAEVLRIFLSC